MKITDDYKAKIQIWAADPQVIADSPPPKLPNFRSRKFYSYAEMNEWKVLMLKELARTLSVASKKAADRPQDQADIEFLLELQKLGKL